jgi:hypothetical protein
MQNNNNARSGFIYAKKKWDCSKYAKKNCGMILQLLKCRRIDYLLFEEKQVDIPLYSTPLQALIIPIGLYVAGLKYGMQTLKGTVSAIIRRFKILPSNTPLKLDCKISLRSLTGMKIRLESR